MPPILTQVCDVVRSQLPRLVRELEKANELRAIEIKARTGMMPAHETLKAVDAALAK